MRQLSLSGHGPFHLSSTHCRIGQPCVVKYIVAVVSHIEIHFFFIKPKEKKSAMISNDFLFNLYSRKYGTKTGQFPMD